MILGRCSICGKAFEGATLDDLPHFPFCSERCQLIDLGRWADGAYKIPGSPVRPDSESETDADIDDQE